MKQSREEHRKALLAEAEAIIAECMTWEEKTERPTMSQIEELVLSFRQRMGRRMAEEMLKDQEAVQPVEAPECVGCGEKMGGKGKKKVVVESRLGPLAVERTYYYCAHCKGGLFPPG